MSDIQLLILEFLTDGKSQRRVCFNTLPFMEDNNE
jgi:hypothetical protein